MEPSRHFRFCPRCGQAGSAAGPRLPFCCGACGFTFYFSAAIATATFIRRDDGKVIFLRRAKDPAKGKLAPPGGFVDIGERVEDALRREIREEVGLEVRAPEFLCSFPNEYPFLDVTYPVLDFFFTAEAVESATARALDEAESICWLEPTREGLVDDLAFPSVRAAWQLWCERFAHVRKTE